MVDRRLSRSTSFAHSRARRLTSHRAPAWRHCVPSHCFPVLSCCADELADLRVCGCVSTLRWQVSFFTRRRSPRRPSGQSAGWTGLSSAGTLRAQRAIQSHAIWLWKLMRAGCCAGCLSPRPLRLLLIPVSHTSLEGLSQGCGSGMKSDRKPSSWLSTIAPVVRNVI